MEDCPHFKSRFEPTIENRACVEEGQMSPKQEIFLWKTFAEAFLGSG